jgi:uncharacterized protein
MLPMPAVVSDSSPLVYLARLARFQLLRQLYQHIFVPVAVWREVAVEGSGKPEGVQTKLAAAEGWLTAAALAGTPAPSDPAFQVLHGGEREAILLAREKQALLIIDEMDGRRVALRLGLTCTGTLGLLIEAKLRGLLPQIRPELERLKQETNFRFSQELFAAALQLAGES